MHTEKPPVYEDPTSEKLRNKNILNSLLGHLKKAKRDLNDQKPKLELQMKTNLKIAQEIRKQEEEIRAQRIEEFNVKGYLENQRGRDQ